MANLGKILKDEIARVARRHARSESAAANKRATEHRHLIVQLRRAIDALDRRVAFLEHQESQRVAKPDVEAKDLASARFSRRSLKAHRKRLGLSAADYAKLIGVSGLTIYQWEGGKARPRPAQFAKLVAARKLGVREAKARLEFLSGGGKF